MVRKASVEWSRGPAGGGGLGATARQRESVARLSRRRRSRSSAQCVTRSPKSSRRINAPFSSHSRSTTSQSTCCAERRATNRNALYKTLHDARRASAQAGAGRPRDRRAGGMNSAAVEPAARRRPLKEAPCPLVSPSTASVNRPCGTALGDRAKCQARDRRCPRRRARRRARASSTARFGLWALAHPVRGRSARRRPANPGEEGQGLSWGELGVDIITEATGRLRTRADAARHRGRRTQGDHVRTDQGQPADADLVLAVTSTGSTSLSATTSSATSRALPTASPRWRRCSMKQSASGTAS